MNLPYLFYKLIGCKGTGPKVQSVSIGTVEDDNRWLNNSFEKLFTIRR